ncbi:hypothetical protein Acr_06g0007730 [Actinidia rufa]|uniref:Retrotransposon gag domain-containing protein n=1 Tax=Actinidia rufa TaxID=165716 RepID=A0A7J0EQX5_9ERIC|nr:hypothetical protein Acr_06g0007730 [Actinidia rufa]
MASQNDNRFGICQTREKAPHVPKTLGDRGAKLLADAQMMAKATSKQRPSRLLSEGEDDWDITIKRLQAQLAKMAHILVDNRLMKPPRIDEGEPSKGKFGGIRDPPHGTRREKRHESRIDLESQGDSRSMESSKRSASLRQAYQVKKMMALWNHMDALMCRVFPSSLGDLRLKWFDKLPIVSIESFHQLTESFVAQFVINTKAPKGVRSHLTLRKGKNESIRNYNKRYWKTYNKIEECSKELALASYKLKQTPRESFWET